MTTPTYDSVSELLGWRVPHGVISAYVSTRPGERGDAWHTELRNGLHEAIAAANPEARAEVEKAATRISDRLIRDGYTPRRTEIAFVAPGTDREMWFSLNADLERPRVGYGKAASVRPLLAVLDDFGPNGVAVVSGEHVRLLGYSFGELHEIADWELEIFEDEWRDRRAPRVRDVVTGGTTTSSSGRDLADHRMAANRDRFVGEVGTMVAEHSSGAGWRELLAFGDEHYVARLRKVLGNNFPVVHAGTANLIGKPPAAIAGRVAEYLTGANRQRELTLLERIENAARASGVTGGGTLGPVETTQALALGRIGMLLIDADRDFEPFDLDSFSQSTADDVDGNSSDAPALPVAEQMVDMALRTDAKVIPLEGEAAERLEEHRGVAGLLRY